MLNLIYRLSLLLNFNLFFNLILCLILVFSKNYLEEDLIIGLFSSIILFLLFFSLKELKKENIRQLRLSIKRVYRIQKKLLIFYYFFFNIILKRFLKYTKKINSKSFFIRLRKTFIKFSYRFKIFISKLFFVKIFNMNNLLTLGLNRLNLFLN